MKSFECQSATFFHGKDVTRPANEPAQHNHLCTPAPLDKIPSSAGSRDGTLRAIPSAHAASAHASVRPYAGADRESVSPTPDAAAASAERCPRNTSRRGDADSSAASAPFRFGRAAALVHPKCTVSGTRSADGHEGSLADAAADPAECTNDKL